jgi:type VI secretion system ImpC/EvpB family protein
VERDRDGGGLLKQLPIETHMADRHLSKPPIDAIITDELEKELSDRGFIPLCVCQGTPYVAFYSGSSIQQPKQYLDEVASMNAKLSSMIHHMLCVSRFAHFLKVRGRDMVGSRMEPDDIRLEFDDWIRRYTLNQPSASLENKIKFPLFDADVQITDIAGKSGAYKAVFDLQPHYEIENISAKIRLMTDLTET